VQHFFLLQLLVVYNTSPANLDLVDSLPHMHCLSCIYLAHHDLESMIYYCYHYYCCCCCCSYYSFIITIIVVIIIITAVVIIVSGQQR